MAFIISTVGFSDLEDADDGVPKFRGRYLDDLMDTTSAVSHFGPDYRDTFISVPVMQAIIRDRFTPPARPLGIRFPLFTIDPICFEYVDTNNEILSDIGCMSERFKWYCEVDDVTPEEWLCSEINEDIILRHIPLFLNHTNSAYFHAHHLDAFMHYAFRMSNGVQIFGR